MKNSSGLLYINELESTKVKLGKRITKTS